MGGGSALRFLVWLLGFSRLPTCVWAAPKGLERLVGLGDVASGSGDPAVRVPEELPVVSSLPRQGAPEVYDSCVSPPRGPPPPLPVRTEIYPLPLQSAPVVLQEHEFAVWACSPFYLPEQFHMPLRVPCDLEDALDVVGRFLRDLELPFCDRIVAVRPQPLPNAMMVLVTPDWSAYSALSVVCLDLRAMRPEGDGPLLAAYVSRPTSFAELEREAGLYGRRWCQIYIGTSPDPARGVLLLHTRGKFLFRQVGDAVRYVVLTRPYLTKAELLALLPRRPPPSWRLRVLGGRKRRDRLDIRDNETLIFGFQHDVDSDQYESYYSTSDDGDDDPGDDGSEGSEEEDDEHGSSDSTRSRSRRGRRRQTRDVSSDRSFHGSFPEEDTQGDRQRDASAHCWGTEDAYALDVGLSCSAVCAMRKVDVLAGPFAFCKEGPSRLSVDYAAWTQVGLEGASAVMWPSCFGLSAVLAGNKMDTSDVMRPGWLSLGGRAEAQARLQDLRFVTTELGGAWPYFPSDEQGNVMGLGQALVDEVVVDPPEMCWLQVLVLKPDYWPERLWIALRLPSTVEEAQREVQAARGTVEVAAFPHLRPAAPQPVSGTCVFVANPVWLGLAMTACVDARAVDGRLFTCVMPDYVDRDDVLRVIGCSLDPTLQVFAGVDQTPMVSGVQVHLFPAITIRIVLGEVEGSDLEDLGQLLATDEVWRQVAVLEIGAREGAYCVVLRSGGRLYLADVAQPLQYRRHLAAYVGMPEMALAIFPAAPRVGNIAVDGYLCCTVLAVASRALLPEGEFCFLVDCRPLLQGWMYFYSSAQQIPFAQVLQVLNQEAPLGWCVELDGRRQLQDTLPGEAGQVLLACYVPDGEHIENDPGGFDAEELVDFHAWIWGHGFTRGAEVANVAPDTADDSASWFGATFLVIAYEVVTEVVRVDLQASATQWQAFAEVNAARSAIHRERFPALVEAFPQVDTAFGVLVAQPVWLRDEAIVVVDGRHVDNRLFALLSARRTSVGSLLASAGYAHEEVLVYVRDDPWPSSRDVILEVASGDLVIVARVDHGMLVTAVLADMLMSASGWDEEVYIPEFAEDHAWVLAETEPFCVPIPQGIGESLREHLGQMLGVDEYDLFVQEARPEVRDHAERGQPTSMVVIAVPDSFRRRGARQGAVCVLDLRALLLGITCVLFERGLLVETELCRRFPFCPDGFRVIVSGGHPGIALPLGTREVRDGDVLRVSFQRLVQAPADPVRSQDVDFPDGDDEVIEAGIQVSSATSQGDHELLGGGRLACLSVDGSRDMVGQSNVRARRRRGHGLFGPFARTCMVAIWISGCAETVAATQQAGSRQAEEMGSCLGDAAAGMLRDALRSIATPCRAYVLPGEVFEVDTAAWDLVDGPTLLEECYAADDSGLFEARVVLEALFEHFRARFDAADDAARQVQGAMAMGDNDRVLGRDPCRLSLYDQLGLDMCPQVAAAGPERFEVDVGQCVLPCSVGHVQELCIPLAFSALQGVPPGVERPFRFQDWVEVGCRGRSLAPGEALMLTTDGSFSSRDGVAGWGLVVSAIDARGALPGCFLGCAFAPFEESLLGAGVGRAQPDAYFAEVLGLLWAALFALRLPVPGDVIMRADNMAALQGVEGVVAMKSHPLCSLARNLHVALRMLHVGKVIYQHVQGHSGDPANELADGVAGLGAKTGRCQVPFAVEFTEWLQDGAARARWLPHVCMTLSQQGTLPPLRGPVMSWHMHQKVPLMPASQLLAPFVRGLQVDKGRDDGRLQCLNVTCASYNALSLLQPSQGNKAAEAGLHGAEGRVTLLSDSLHKHKLFVVGLQETRTPRGSSQTEHYVRYCSGCTDRRAYGVELWVARGRDWPTHQAVVLFADYTRLIASVSFASFCVQILVGHAPHRAYAEEARKAWWNETARLCAQFRQVKEWLVLVDANCRVGSFSSSWIGSWQADEEDCAGRLFHSLVEDLSVWLPSTFEASMKGAGGTLLQRHTGEMHRSDFVGIPVSWRSFGASAWVAPRVTAGHAAPDHFAVVVSCQLVLAGTPERRKISRIDPRALLDPDNEAKIRAVLQEIPQVPWEVNVNEHAAILSEGLHTRLVELFPLQARRMRASFLTEETAHVHAEIARLRHDLRRRLVVLEGARLRCAWLAWSSAGERFTELFECSWTRQVRAAVADAAARIGGLGKLLRRLCRRDKRQHIRGLASEVGSVGPSEVHTALRRVLRPRKFRRAGGRPLPLLKRPDGSVCESLDAVQQEWRRHFAELESGVEVDIGELAQQCVERQQKVGALEWLDSCDLPDYETVVQTIRQVKPLKASGPDMLPPAICKKFAFDLTALVWPVILKSLVFRAEPVGYKGGTLYHIPKSGNGGLPLCTSDRGILAQPILGKILHKSIRGLALRGLDKRALDVQIGGRAGMSFMMGCYCTRLFLDYARTYSKSAGVLFCDLASAYYAVVRELLLGKDLTHATLEEVTESLKLTSEDLQLLRAYVDHEVILNEEGDESVLQALAREVHTHTWFWLCQVLRRRGDFAEQGLCPQIPWSGRRELVAFDARRKGCVHTRVQDVVYADDLATCILAESAALLPSAIRLVAGTQLDTLAAHGLRANLGVRKTATIMVPAGAGAKQVRHQVFTQGKGKLHIFRENGGAVVLDAVASYRLAAARAAFKEGRQMLRIPLSAEQNWTKERIFGELGLPGVEGLVALERLRFLAQLCRSGPDAVFALLQHSRSALAAMQSAMTWLVQAVENTSELKPGCDWEVWTAVFGQPGRFKGLLKRAAAWHVGRLRACAHYQLWCRVLWAPAPAPEVEVEVAQHMCLVCGIAFFDFHAWSAHAARVHKYRSRAVRYTQGKQCRACCMRFPTVIRHRRHLQFHPACCRAVEWDLPGLVPPVLGPDEHAQAESIPGCGLGHLPSTPVDVAVGVLRTLQGTTFESDVEIFEVLKGFIEPFPMLRATLSFWRDGLEEGPVRAWANDVLLCMQVDLWCTNASRVPKARPETQDCFVPLLFPFVWDRSKPAKQVRVVGPIEAADDLPGGIAEDGEVTSVDFWSPVPAWFVSLRPRWRTYSANPDIAADFYGFENPKASIDMLLNWGPIMYLPVAPVAGWMIARHPDSIWAVVFCGGALTAAGLVLRLLPTLLGFHPTSPIVHGCIHVGQALNGAAGPANCVTPSALAAMWFPPHQRGFATSAVFAIQMAGPTLGFLLGLCVHSCKDLVLLLEVEAAMSVAVLAVWACLPRKPSVPPSRSQEIRRSGEPQASAVPRRRMISTWVLLLAAGAVVGVFQCWSPALPTQLQGVLPETVLKWFAVITSLASVIGNFTAPQLIEMLHLQHRLKSVLGITLCLQLVAYALFAVLLPDSPLPLMKGSTGMLMACVVLASIAEGAMAPIVYELSAELTYPMSEGVTGAAFSWLINFFGMVLLAVYPVVPSAYDSIMMVAVGAVALIGLQLVIAEYPRRELDDGACGTELLRD
ncbi:unnamed protein product [Symbiodinium sp. CCMP2456]|nr:unnamed protein product [Symbiodinium sp. CCMP2456]